MAEKKKTIAVVGATGAQGGSLVRSIAADKDGPFQARALTRKPESDKGKALSASGVEVVAADLDDAASVERAFAGAYGAFCVTNYWENFIYFGLGPKKGPDGKLAITLPMDDKKLPGIAAEDIGKTAYAIFKRGKEFVGKTVGIAGEHLSGSEMASAMTRALGQEIRYNAVTPEAYRGLGFPGADDMGNMFQFKRDFNEQFRGARNIQATRALNPELQSFEEWLGRHKTQIPIG